jgi:hypothetical protein
MTTLVIVINLTAIIEIPDLNAPKENFAIRTVPEVTSIAENYAGNYAILENNKTDSNAVSYNNEIITMEIPEITGSNEEMERGSVSKQPFFNFASSSVNYDKEDILSAGALKIPTYNNSDQTDVTIADLRISNDSINNVTCRNTENENNWLRKFL